MGARFRLKASYAIAASSSGHQGGAARDEALRPGARRQRLALVLPGHRRHALAGGLLDELKACRPRAFEAVDTSRLMVTRTACGCRRRSARRCSTFGVVPAKAGNPALPSMTVRPSVPAGACTRAARSADPGAGRQLLLISGDFSRPRPEERFAPNPPSSLRSARVGGVSKDGGASAGHPSRRVAIARRRRA